MIERIAAISSLTGTATKTVPLMVATRAGKFVRPSLGGFNYVAEGATDGTKTLQIKNNTRNKNITAVLTISGIAALTKTAFTDVAGLLDDDLRFNKGDVIVAIYTVSVAGTVAPGEMVTEMLLRHGRSGEVGDQD